jgi:hypothetical protein
MYTNATAAFVSGANGSQAEVNVEITPRDFHQHELFRALDITGVSIDEAGGRFLVSIRLAKPEVPSVEPSNSAE